MPFDIPNTWEWVTLENISSYIQKGKSPKYSDVESFPVLGQRCIQWEGVLLEKARFITPESFETYDKIRYLEDEDLLLNCLGHGSLGRIALYDESLTNKIVVADSRIMVIRLFKKFVLPKFIYYFWASASVQQVIDSQSEGSTNQKMLNLNLIKNYHVPLPPLNEQKRIINKINELNPHIKTYSQIEEELNKLNEEFPKKIKDSILQEAVKGNLVLQDPKDEPASVLLEKIRDEKERLVKEKIIKKNKNESVIYEKNNHFYERIGKNEPKCIDDEIPFEIPDNWQWCRMENIIQLISGRDMKSNEYNDIQKGIPYITGASNIENGALVINRWIENPGVVSIKNDILLTCKGTIGKLLILNEPKVHIARQIMAIRIINENLIFRDFVLLILEYYVKKLQIMAKSMIPGISREDVLKIFVPLPPIKEQIRIVEKINQLNAIYY